jgi:hypothetical protein
LSEFSSPNEIPLDLKPDLFSSPSPSSFSFSDFLNDMENKTHKARVRTMVTIGKYVALESKTSSSSSSPESPALDICSFSSLISSLYSSTEFYHRSLALHSCYGSFDLNLLKKGLSDSSHSLQSLAISLLPLVVSASVSKFALSSPSSGIKENDSKMRENLMEEEAIYLSVLNSSSVFSQLEILKVIHHYPQYQAIIDKFIESNFFKALPNSKNSVGIEESSSIEYINFLRYGSETILLRVSEQFILNAKLLDWKRVARSQPDSVIKLLNLWIDKKLASVRIDENTQSLPSAEVKVGSNSSSHVFLNCDYYKVLLFII